MTQWQPQPYDPSQQRPETPPQWQRGPAQPPYGYGQPQYQPPQPQYAPQPPQQAPRKSRKGLAFLGCGGLFALFVIIAVVAGSHSSSSSAPPAVQSSAAVPPVHSAAPTHGAAAAHSAAPTKAPAAKTVATFSGSGIQNTPQFTVTSTWVLSYAFDCSSFGYKGNFQVFEDGGADFSGVTVNDLAMSKSASTYAYNDAGTHYLKVNSECSWSMKVIDEG